VLIQHRQGAPDLQEEHTASVQNSTKRLTLPSVTTKNEMARPVCAPSVSCDVRDCYRLGSNERFDGELPMGRAPDILDSCVRNFPRLRMRSLRLEAIRSTKLRASTAKTELK
jgi:hypothetical protein